MCYLPLFAQGDSSTEEVGRTVIKNGVGLGAVIAVVASWSRNASILWAILHGLFSWFYVIYFALSRSSER
ncbi:hypothetical protein D1627_08995 [Pontibacter oryzae]|uniref:Uncharacterized protein n=1 Tax=Pontibacter oryzae TaxID=2304593 RepID=A0A399S652_9BACT|nr:hypothetical protein D1627_08995 [Pontibacter oryzae]